MKSEIDTLKEQLESVSGAERVDILNRLSGAYFDKSATTALEYSKEALHLSRETGYRQGEAVALRGIGNIFYLIGDYAEALPNYQASLEIEKEINNVSSIAGVLNNIAMIHAMTGEIERALECNMEAMKLLEGTDDKSGISRIILNNIGNNYMQLEDYDKSLEFYKQSLSISEKMGDQRGAAFSLSNTALVFHKQGKFDEAVKYHQKALDIRKKLKHKYGLASTLLKMGNCIMESGEISRAREYLEEGMQIAEEENFKDLVKDGLEWIGIVLEREENYKEALDFRKRYSKLRETLYSEESGRTIIKMQAQFDIKQKTMEIESLEAKVRERTADIARKNEELEREITERKQLEDQFRQSQKMEGIGRLAGGIAHDFNNLLTVISGHAELAFISLNKQDPLLDDLKEIQNAANRAAELTRQLLAFSRKQTLQPKVLDLNDIIRELDKMLKRVIGEDIDLETIAAPDLWRVNVDPGQVEQVIINLAVNARDAMPGGGKLTIETQNVELDEEYTVKHPEVKPGPHVMLAISDTGCGMTDELKSQIFEPFFTTKEKGKGTGLGLSTVYGIVKQSGGSIWVYSELDKGTTFKIYLPMVTQEADELSREADVSEAPRGTETILVVEDEEGVRKLACLVLKRQGYEVLEAESGVDALLMCQELKKQVDIVVTDVIMPNMSGTEFVEKLREFWSDFKVLYMSGYTSNAIVHAGVLDRGIPYLQKPFRPVDIARKVRRVLDE